MEGLSDSQLLRLRFCDLPELKSGIAGTPLEDAVRQLHAELKAKGLKFFQPHVYLGDEWFSPSGLPLIAAPFYLAHPRLKKLERTMRREVEGGTRPACMRLLRHEAGHCFDHAYQVSRMKTWRQIFGAPSRRYRPDVFVANHRSQDFVRNLPGNYAQAHPDEDFAETFAVVVDPHSAWREVYGKAPVALAKLEFVASLIKAHGGSHPRLHGGEPYLAVSRMRTTLKRHYEKRLATDSAHRQAAARLAATRQTR